MTQASQWESLERAARDAVPPLPGALGCRVMDPWGGWSKAGHGGHWRCARQPSWDMERGCVLITLLRLLHPALPEVCTPF